MTRDEESALRFVMKVKMKGNTLRGRSRLRWPDNIDSHMKGKSKSRKEILRTKCFKNIQDLRTLISLTGVLEKILELLPGVW